MEVTKKICNVFGIIIAWILSIALVVMLIAAPLVLSVLSFLDVNTLIDTVTEALVQQLNPFDQIEYLFPSDETASTYEVTKLSNESDTITGALTDGKDILTDIIGSDMFGSDIFGESVSPEVVEQILSSNAAKELLNAYADGFTNSLTGEGDGTLDPAVVEKILNDNLDEVVELVKTAVPEDVEINIDELKEQISGSVEQVAQEITNLLPQPKDLTESILTDVPELEIVFQIMAQKDAIQSAYISAIVVLCVLIFLFRLPGFRGFRWLATDLFIGGGFCALQTGILYVFKPMVQGIGDANVAALLSTLLQNLTTDVLKNTVIMLVSAIVLLVIYLIIKKALAKKNAKEKYDIIVLAGQSNAEGQGYGESSDPFIPDERIHFMKDDCGFHFVTTDGVSVLHYNWPSESTITVADEREKNGEKLGCFALQFAKKYAAECLAKDRKVLIVNANFGGTGFHRPEWGVGNIMHERMVSMTQEALSYNPRKNRVVAILWSQGEHDAFEDADWDPERRYAVHKENLTTTFADFYERTGCKDAPFIACGFTDTYCESTPVAAEAVLKAIKECVAAVDGGFVDSTGLLSNSQNQGGGDIYHFSKEALRILGEKFFDKYLELKK